MSNEENAKEENAKKPLDAAQEMAGKLFAALMELKENKPKVFYGGAGGVVLLLIIMMSGGDGGTKVMPKPNKVNHVIGQRYVLKNPNSYEVASPVQLVTVPGAIAAYDDSEDQENGKVDSCRRIAQGTAVSVQDLQDAYGKKNAFVKIQVEEGECKGSTGWVLAIDVQ